MPPYANSQLTVACEASRSTEDLGALARHMALRGERVAIVDDEEAVTFVTSTLLRRLGYTTVCYESATSLVKALESTPEKFDIVLADVVMPGMSGVQMAHALRQAGHSVPILLMTGLSTEGRVHAGVATERIPFVRKPFSASLLAQSIWRLIHRSRMRREMAHTT